MSGGDGCCQPGQAGGRLNLLLSYAGWHQESWADRLPRLLEPMGITAVRAATGREATRVIASTTVHIAIVDLGLPLDETPAARAQEEGGSRLLELLSRQPSPPPTVAVKRARTHRDDCREISAALRFGAFAVIDRPQASGDLEILLDVMRRALRRFYQGRWPGLT
ncbi:MAG: response regulator [Phycisphaerales bacterium]|nr:response regulator [Phycisphaerales bacterium]